jgi:hypothetical protein
MNALVRRMVTSAAALKVSRVLSPCVLVAALVTPTFTAMATTHQGRLHLQDTQSQGLAPAARKEVGCFLRDVVNEIYSVLGLRVSPERGGRVLFYVVNK